MALIRQEQIGTAMGLIQPKQIAGFAGAPLLSLYDGQFNRDNGANVSCRTAANRLSIVGGDIMRRQDRGVGAGSNFFVEPARTQLVRQSIFFTAPWAVANGAVLTSQSTLGPDSYAVHLASLVALSASAVSQIAQTLAIGVVPVDTAITFSVWAKAATGSGNFKFQVFDHDGVQRTSSVVVATSFWARYSFTTVAGANAATAYVVRLVNGDATAHGVFFAHPMVEANTEASSYIFNDTTANASSAPDVLQFVPAQIPLQYRAGRSSGTFYCQRSTANMIVNADQMVIRSFGGTNETLELTSDGANVKLLARSGGVTKAASLALTLAEYEAGAYIVDPVAGQITVNGAPGPVGTPWQWPAGVSVRFGGLVAGANEFRGELAQEYAA